MPITLLVRSVTVDRGDGGHGGPGGQGRSIDDSRQERPGALAAAMMEAGGPPVRASSLRAHIRQRATEHFDQRLAAVCHFSIGFGIVIGVGFLLGIAINLLIWLRSKRSPVVAYHAEQAGAYQLAVLITNLTMVGIWTGILITLMGRSEIGAGMLSIWDMLAGMWLALLPLQVAWYFGSILYGLYAGLVVAAGRDFSYPIFGKWARKRMAAHAK